MILLISIIFIMIGMALLMNIYSIFNPFIENLGQIQEYNQAYYGAISGLERAELVAKYHDFGFEGSGGWLGNNGYGPNADNKISNFTRLSENSNGILWTIKSLTNGNNIPISGKSNIDPELQRFGNDYGGKSSNYNKFEISSSVQIPLYKDDTGSNPSKYYTGISAGDTTNLNVNYISGSFRLPPVISSGFNDNLDDSTDSNYDGIKDDIIVDRALIDTDKTKDPSQAIKIYPISNVNYNNGVGNSLDSNFRESNINNGNNNINFGNNKNPTNGDNSTYHNITPMNSPLSGDNFNTLFANPNLNLLLQFNIPNIRLLTSFMNSFPYIEYKIDINGTNGKYPLPYYTINGIGKVGKYNIIIEINKNIIDSSAEGFATIHF